MQSTAKTVTAYLDEVPTERKAALNKLRDLCRTSLKGFEESMKYGGPCYSRNGEIEVGFASQKNFIRTLHSQNRCDEGPSRFSQSKGSEFGQGLYPLFKTGEN